MLIGYLGLAVSRHAATRSQLFIFCLSFSCTASLSSAPPGEVWLHSLLSDYTHTQRKEEENCNFLLNFTVSAIKKSKRTITTLSNHLSNKQQQAISPPHLSKSGLLNKRKSDFPGVLTSTCVELYLCQLCRVKYCNNSLSSSQQKCSCASEAQVLCMFVCVCTFSPWYHNLSVMETFISHLKHGCSFSQLYMWGPLD